MRERVIPQSLTPSDAPTVAYAGVEASIARVIAAGNSPAGQAAADELGRQLQHLAGLAPIRETRDLLQRLLSNKALDACVDTRGFSCRAAVVGALVRLGYPWALEVTPEDLQSWRASEVPVKSFGGAQLLTIAVGSLSLLWNGGLALGFTLSDYSWVHRPNPSGMLLITLPFWVGTAHALAAMVASGKAKHRGSTEERRTAFRRYSVLGWMPIAAVAAALATHPPMLWIGMLCAIPAMLTGLSCAFAASRIQPSPDADP